MHPTTKVMAVAVLGGLLSAGAVSGCGGHTTRTTQTTTETVPADDDELRPPPEERTTTTTTTESEESSPGIVGSAFQLVWAVISFPFRVIGALF